MARPSDRILVTGASGLTGRLLMQRLLAEGAAVFGLRRTPRRPWEVRGDLKDAASLAEAVKAVRPTHVLHLGGVTFPAHGDEAEIYQVNVAGAAGLLGALKRHASPEAVIVPSSATVYAPPADAAPIAEDAPLRPQTHYAVSKAAVEEMARLFAAQLPIVVTRPFNYTGAGQAKQFLVPKIVDHFARGERAIELGNLELDRDFSDARTIVEAYLRLLARPPVGQTLNLCSGRAVRLGSILDEMAAIAGYAIEVRVNPAFVRPGEPAAVIGSTRRMDQILGPLRSPPLADTLRWMYEAARAAG